MCLKPNEKFAWIARRIRVGIDDELLDWPRAEVEAALRLALPDDLADEALALFEERRLKLSAAVPQS